MLKIGTLGAAALLLPLERTVSAIKASSSRSAASALPKPFTVPFAAPPVLAPYRGDSTTDYFKVSMQPVLAEGLPGRRTPLWDTTA